MLRIQFTMNRNIKKSDYYPEKIGDSNRVLKPEYFNRA